MLRNINLTDGLCNGNCLKVKELLQYCICAEIITGNNSGNTVLLSRIDLTTSKDELPFVMKRRQFSNYIRLCNDNKQISRPDI